MNKKEFILVSSFGKYRIAKVERDYALLIVSFLGWGWLKLFMDGRTQQGLINLLLLYTIFGAIIHGVIIAFDQTNHLKALLKDGYRPVNPEDVEEIERLTGIDFSKYKIN